MTAILGDIKGLILLVLLGGSICFAVARYERRRQAKLEEQRQAHAEYERQRQAKLQERRAEQDALERAERRERERQRRMRGEQERQRATTCTLELLKIIGTKYLVEACPRCFENRMGLVSISPTAKSVEYECLHCRKRMRAVVAGPISQKVKELEHVITAFYGEQWMLDSEGDLRAKFSTQDAVMSYEHTDRIRITQALRGQVWRRDNGKCVQCESRENLQLDHIIPVSKGGATTLDNLQVLCRSCNLSKGARI